MTQDANVESMRIEMKRFPKYLVVAAGVFKVSDLSYRAVQLLGSLRYARYLVASAMSLGVDLASFLLMLQINMPAVQASMLGYISGLVVHWLLSSRLVFANKIPSAVAARTRQKLLFVISALIGLAITAALIKCGLQLGINPGLSKLAAIAVSFNVTYMLRHKLIFR
ncbi:MAG: GtrA family protein [Burkholderiaceae bacterium]